MNPRKHRKAWRMNLCLGALLCLPAHAPVADSPPSTLASREDPFAVVLGIAQDGGVPQAGSKGPVGWDGASRRRHVACLGIVDPATSQRWMIEATPDFPSQLHALDLLAPSESTPGLDGIFVTHAHIGHYTGLMYLGHEVMGAREVPVHAMPRMSRFLQSNGPWDQLVRKHNIRIVGLEDGVPVSLNARLTLVPFRVPHRQEYSEVVGFRLIGPKRSLLFLPDIDRWEDLDAMGVHVESMIASVDVAYLDGTFFAHGEIPGRDMTGFPHPFITHSLERFAALPEEERAKIRFIHLNHTNPALEPQSSARRAIEAAGCHVAQELEQIDL